MVYMNFDIVIRWKYKRSGWCNSGCCGVFPRSAGDGFWTISPDMYFFEAGFRGRRCLKLPNREQRAKKLLPE